MPIDNDLYDRLSTTWWEETGALSILRTWFNPIRFGYFRRILLDELQIDLHEKQVVDIGCGGGLLAEEFAHLDCQVTGIDPSVASLEIAREHAQQSGLQIFYQKGVGEQLPFDEHTFDIAICCDVLEHVNDVGQVIREIARVLKPGGFFFYDTINRTFLSWLADIKLAQEWELTSFMPPHLHEWDKFIKPVELKKMLQQAHLEHREIKGISPRTLPPATIRLFIQQKRRKITLTEMGNQMKFHESKDLSTSYMGYALKEKA